MGGIFVQEIGIPLQGGCLRDLVVWQLSLIYTQAYLGFETHA